MKKRFIIIFVCCFYLFGFEIEGNPQSWQKEDFIGFDRVGDCTSQIGGYFFGLHLCGEW